MNSAVKLALAGAMSIASVSGVALAQTAAPMVDSTTTTNSTTMATEGVSIIRLDSLDTACSAGTPALSRWQTTRQP